MNGWIIYNGALTIKKNEKLVHKLKEDGKKIGIDLVLIKNNELIPMVNNHGQCVIHGIKTIHKPDFVIFWDKDVYLAAHLEKMGYPVLNSSEAIKNCDNKALMHLKLSNEDIKVPKTIISPFVFREQKLSSAYFKKVEMSLGYPLILKEAYGSFGMQVYLIKNEKELISKIKTLGYKRFILQEAIESSFGEDIRVNIIGNQVIGAMKRKSQKDFRANITLGGIANQYVLSDREKQLALKAHRVLDLNFSGVDLLVDSSNEVYVCEVNSNVNFLSFEEATGINYGDLLLKHILRSFS